MSRPNPFFRLFDFLASTRLAIPLLVLLAAATIAGSVIPQGENVNLAEDLPAWVGKANEYLQLNDIFGSWWYVSLLGVLGLCLVAISLRRLPAVWRQRGTGVGMGIFLSHAGVLVILGGALYGAVAGFRYYIHVVEGEVTVLPALPFVIKLDALDVKYYSADTFRHRGANTVTPERQDSRLTLLRHGDVLAQGTSSPGWPLTVEGVTLLPARGDVGWAFDLLVQAPNGKDKVVPIQPWSPALVELGWGNTGRILAHRLGRDGVASRYLLADDPKMLRAEIFMLNPDRTHRSLGFATPAEPLAFENWKFSVVRPRRYTGLQVYSRPENPYLIAGVVLLLVGLIGYFTRWGSKLVPRRFRSLAPAPGLRPEGHVAPASD